MIRIRNLHKAFGTRVVLAGIDAEIRPGAIVAIHGPSGCGKSTLLRCLVGLEPFESGSIEIAGHVLHAKAKARSALARLSGDVALVFQEFHLFPHLSVLENLTLAPERVRKVRREEAERHASELLALVGLADRASARPAELSGGQKQRVAILRALAQGASVLCFDEPTSALDPSLREEVRDVLRRVARGEIGHAVDAATRTLVLVTHETDLARELATETWHMKDGRLVERRGS
ncbi:MAG TPA: amino acid ABC transporter ATP-binding protein [Polyangiaceae bacterium]|nr:amino acid ABC transporter ATP-binding protein [Polyangiaceae bacterium]